MGLSFQAPLSELTRPAAAVRPSAVAPKRAASVPMLFGASDSFQASHKKYILVPAGTPIFFLHGTSNTGKKLNPLIYWFQRDVRTDHPGYVSYSPEVQHATGIERVEDPEKTTPAYIAALRDMGDFRLQTINLRMKTLRESLKPASGNWGTVPDEALADFFQIRTNDRQWLTPLIRAHLLPALTQVPTGWETVYDKPLNAMVDEGLVKLRAELAKLRLRPDESDLPIYDTDFLNTKAVYEGKTANFSMDNLDPDPEVINIRSIHLKDLAEMESYLMVVERNLADAIQTAMPSKANESADAHRKRAERTAARLMEVIAPRTVTIGHSQGGTALHSALLNYALSAPYNPDTFRQTSPKAYLALPGRSVGMEVGLSAPLKGIPDMPLWGKKLVQRLEKLFEPLPRKQRDFMLRQVHNIGWHLNERGAPAIEEMRAGSDLMKKFQEHLKVLENRGITVISAYDKDDSYVEPEASKLQDAKGQTPENVFNLELESEPLPAGFTTPDDFVALIVNLMPTMGPWIVRLMPGSIKRYIHNVYKNDLITLEQHRSLITMPNFMSQQIGRKLIEDPQGQLSVLGSSNYEAFRYQSLVARTKSFERKIVSQPLPTAAALLNEFHQKHPRFIEKLIENARDDVPLRNSAAYQANELLEKTLELMAKILAEPALKARYAVNLRKTLRLISEAHLPVVRAGHESVSVIAGRMLSTFDA